mmetsp:Transcript_12214/g.26548  ORF Transcript_12214/g.26548 Transcript_12214/m.26548 type:complete len:487 (+) Transcript_12214:1024-2484(+)
MQSELTGLPLLEALEDEGHGAHVRDIELLEDARCLLVVLAGWSTNEGESRQVDNGVDDGLAETIIVVFLDRSREVKSARVDGDNPGTPALELGNQRDIVCVVLGVDVALLQNDSDSRCRLGINAGLGAVLGVVPPEVVLIGLKDDIRRHRVPNGLVREKNRFLHYSLFLALHGRLDGADVVLSNHGEEGLEILRRASKPVLERHHERPRVSSLVTRQELQHLRQSPEQLQHALLKRAAVLLFLLLHEISNDTLALSKVLHRERSNLVQPHDLGHTRENEHGVELIPQGRDHLTDFLRQFLHKDERTDENIGISNVLLELLEGVLVTELLEEVPDALDRHAVAARVDALGGGRHGALVLRLKDDVDDLHRRSAPNVLGDDSTVLGIRRREHASPTRFHVGGICDDIECSGSALHQGRLGVESVRLDSRLADGLVLGTEGAVGGPCRDVGGAQGKEGGSGQFERCHLQLISSNTEYADGAISCFIPRQ